MLVQHNRAKVEHNCLDFMDRLRKHHSHLAGVWKESCLGSDWVSNIAHYCMFVNEWAWSKLPVCLLKQEVDMGSVLELELGQKWRYGALKTCLC